MFILGILGILQILFLPGLILVRFNKFKSGFVTNLIAVVASSLIINYVAVFFLTALHFYLRPLILALVLCEVAVLLWLYRNQLMLPVGNSLQKWITNAVAEFRIWIESLGLKKEPSSIHLLIKIAYILFSFVLAFVSLNWIWKLLVWNLGSVFNSYDTIALWNRWAIDWYNNSLPANTWRYAQLLPVNWSVLFKMVGDPSIQFFAQAIMPLFAFLILLMIIDLGFKKQNLGFFLGSAITYLVFKKFLGPFLIDGLADIPCAFFAFAAVYLLFSFHNDRAPVEEKYSYGFFIAASAAGCAATKQVGAVFLMLFLVIFTRFFFIPLFSVDKKKFLKIGLISLALILLIAAPWYLYKQVLIWQGLEKSEIGMIVGATNHTYNSAGVIEKFLEIKNSLGKYFYLLVLLVPMSLVVEPLLRYINIFLIFPLFISWGLFASYDFRNLALALPLFGISSGVSLQYLMDYALYLFRKLPLSHVNGLALLIALTAGCLASGLVFFTDDRLNAAQSEKVMNTFSPEINHKVISSVQNDNGEFLIITNYPLDNLPGMQGKKISSTFSDFAEFQSTLASSKTDNLYLLVPKSAENSILDLVSKKIKTGDFTLLFKDNSWIPYQFIKVNED